MIFQLTAKVISFFFLYTFAVNIFDWRAIICKEKKSLPALDKFSQ